MALNERDAKAAKLKHFNPICSQVTDEVFVGSDNGARALPPPPPRPHPPRRAPPLRPSDRPPRPRPAPSRQWRATCRSCGRTASPTSSTRRASRAPTTTRGPRVPDAQPVRHAARGHPPLPVHRRRVHHRRRRRRRQVLHPLPPGRLALLVDVHRLPHALEEDPVRHTHTHTIREGVDHTPHTAHRRSLTAAPHPACGCRYDEAFNLIKTVRGVANPNTGFICRLLEFGQRIGLPSNQKPMAPLRLYRMSPWYGAPVARPIDGELSSAELDTRSAFVLHVAPQDGADPQALYVWVARARTTSIARRRTAGRRSSRSSRARRRRRRWRRAPSPPPSGRRWAARPPSRPPSSRGTTTTTASARCRASRRRRPRSRCRRAAPPSTRRCGSRRRSSSTRAARRRGR